MWVLCYETEDNHYVPSYDLKHGVIDILASTEQKLCLPISSDQWRFIWVCRAIRLMTCQLIGNYSDREFNHLLQCYPTLFTGVFGPLNDTSIIVICGIRYIFEKTLGTGKAPAQHSSSKFS